MNLSALAPLRWLFKQPPQRREGADLAAIDPFPAVRQLAAVMLKTLPK